MQTCFTGGPDAPPDVVQKMANCGIRFAAPVTPEPVPRPSQTATPSATKKVRHLAKEVRKQGRHYPSEDPNYDPSRANPRQCAHCKKKRSTYWCPTCQLPLCVVPCFKMFHEDE